MRPLLLQIEDNAQNRYLASYLLERRGYQVISAEDGPSGIALAIERTPDLILLDIQLPMMDGHEVALRLRQIRALAQTPIVAVTSYAMTGDREKAIASGCDGYIEKPINPDTFVAEVAAFLPPSLRLQDS